MKQFSDCGITIRNTGESSPSTNHIIVEDCEIVNCDNSGIIVTSKNHNVGDAGAQPSVITIRDNEVSYVNEDVASNEAITIHDTKDCEVYDNYVHHYYKEGIDVKKGCENVEVFRNIVTVNLGSYAGAGIYIDGAQAGLTNIDVYDNLVFNGHAGIYVAFESGAGTGNAVEDVLIYNNVVWGSDESEFRLCKCNSSTGLIKNSKVFNNTFEGSVDKWVVSITETVASKIENFQFKNNIVARSVVGTEDLFHHVSGVASKLTIDTNLYYSKRTS